MKQIRLIVVFTTIIFFVVGNSSTAIGAAKPHIENINFSEAKVEFLRGLDKRERIANFGTTILGWSPLIQILAAPNPVDVAITVATANWDQLGHSLAAFNRIKVCTFASDIEGFLLEPHSEKSQRFFEALRDHYAARCK